MTVSITTSQRTTGERFSEDRYGRATYTGISWIHEVNTLGISPAYVQALAQALSGGNRCPVEGEHYNYGGVEDFGSYCQGIDVYPLEPKEREIRFRIDAKFEPLPPGITAGILQETDPLSWPTVFDLDYLEDQIPVEYARVVEALTQIGRAANSYGKVVNPCGVEFTDPLMDTENYPIIVARKNFASIADIYALNRAFFKTQNSDTFFGNTTRKCAWVRCESGGEQRIKGTTFYPGTIKIVVKDATWDRQVLANGWGHFVKRTSGVYQKDNAGKLYLAPNMVAKVSTNLGADNTAAPTEHCSEPLNLDLDGTLLAPDQPAKYLTYRTKNEVAYSGIGIGS